MVATVPLMNCFKCKGVAEFVSLGGMKEKCLECNGRGKVPRTTNKDVAEFLDKKPDAEIPDLQVLGSTVVTKKKMGRPKKVA